MPSPLDKHGLGVAAGVEDGEQPDFCLLYTSDAADERSSVDLGGRRIIKTKKKQKKENKKTHIKETITRPYTNQKMPNNNKRKKTEELE